MTGSAPSAVSAHAASRSSFDPGKTRTPTRGLSISAIAMIQLDLVAFDQRIREQALAHALDLRAGGRRRGCVHLDVDQAADSSLADGEAEVAERALYCLTLRIADPRLRSHEHGRLHVSTTFGSDE